MAARSRCMRCRRYGNMFIVRKAKPVCSKKTRTILTQSRTVWTRQATSSEVDKEVRSNVLCGPASGAKSTGASRIIHGAFSRVASSTSANELDKVDCTTLVRYPRTCSLNFSFHFTRHRSSGINPDGVENQRVVALDRAPGQILVVVGAAVALTLINVVGTQLAWHS